MAVAIDTSNDWQLVEDRETVTLFPKEGSDKVSLTGSMVPNAKRLPIKKDFLDPTSPLANQDITWSVWRNQLGGLVPRMGMVVQDRAGLRWVVNTIDVLSWSLGLPNRYRLGCTKGTK